MFSKAFSAAALVLAASSLVSAQTFTDCNPLKKTCPADPAFGDGVHECDFTKGECDVFHGMIGTKLEYDGKGAHFIINKESDAPTVRSDNYLFFGRVEVVMQAAAGQGIVTSAVLQSDDLDEIDWEFVGGDDAQVQTNYFYKGDTTTYDRGAYHPVAAPLTSYHTYVIEWNSQAVNWIIDGAIVRTLSAADAGDNYPQTPMQVKLGTWVAGGKNTAEGTVQWAGGYTDFKKAPFEAYYKSVKIVDYAGKDSADQNPGAKEYVYGDKTGSWESIVVKKGNGDDDEKTTTKVTKTTAEATSTKTTAEATTSTEAEETTTKVTKTTEAEKETKTSTVESETEVETETETSTVPKTTTVVSKAETTTTELPTTLAVATSPDGAENNAAATGTEEAGASETSEEPAVVTNGASGLVNSVGAVFAGVFVAQLFI